MSSPRDLVREHWCTLIGGMTDVEDVLDILYQGRVITERISEDIERERDPKKQAKTLLRIIQKRCESGASEAFPKFLSALRETGNEHLADLISGQRRASPPARQSDSRVTSGTAVMHGSLSAPDSPQRRLAGALGTTERRDSSSSSGSEVFQTGIGYTGSENEASGPAAHHDPRTSLAEMSLESSPAPHAAPSDPTASLFPLPAAPVPTLPVNVRYHAKRTAGPVRVLGPDLGSGVKLSYPAGLAYHAPTDSLYVASWRSDEVVVYNSRGNNARVLHTISNPRAIAVSWDGERVYVVNRTWSSSGASLHILTATGEMLKKIRSVPGGTVVQCRAVACYQQQVAVLTGNHGVVILSRDGDYVSQWSLGDVVGLGMTVDGDGNLYITEKWTGTIVVYSWEGGFRERFGEVMTSPHSPGVCVDGDGHVCVSRHREDRVDVCSPDRSLLTSLGGERGHARGQLHIPYGLCLLPDGGLAVADQDNDRVQIF